MSLTNSITKEINNVDPTKTSIYILLDTRWRIPKKHYRTQRTKEINSVDPTKTSIYILLDTR
jgi:hypothetical protein